MLTYATESGNRKKRNEKHREKTKCGTNPNESVIL